jgi:hypothetical protein
MWDPPKYVSFQKWTESRTMDVFWMKWQICPKRLTNLHILNFLYYHI